MKKYAILFNPYTRTCYLNDRGNLFVEDKHITTESSSINEVVDFIIENNPKRNKRMEISVQIPKEFFEKNEQKLRENYRDHVNIVYIKSIELEQYFKNNKIYPLE